MDAPLRSVWRLPVFHPPANQYHQHRHKLKSAPNAAKPVRRVKPVVIRAFKKLISAQRKADVLVTVSFVLVNHLSFNLPPGIILSLITWYIYVVHYFYAAVNQSVTYFKYSTEGP